MSEAKVNTPIAAYTRMVDRWRMPRALMEGTWRLRELATKNLGQQRKRITDATMRERAFFDYLPKDELESDDRYVGRISRSDLYNRFRLTVEHLVGKPLSRPIGIREDNPAEIERWAENIDLTGRNLTVFAQEVFRDAWITGISYVLADYPVVEGGQSRTRADDIREGLRPYLTHIRPEQVIGWRTERANGREVLTQLRITEESVEPEGEFGERLVRRVRVLYPERHQVWEEDAERNEYVLVDERPVSLGLIPLVPIYTGRTAMMEALPPLEDLGWTNIRHFQTQSDQDSILHVAAVPTLFGAGVVNDENEVVIGTDGLITGPLGSSLEWLELHGKSIESREKQLARLEEHMVMQGLQPQIPRTGNVTATATALAEDRAASQLKSGAEGLRDGLETALMYCGMWVGEGREWAGSLDVHMGFELSARDAGRVETLLKSRVAGEISRETYLRQLKRYELLEEDFDVEEELQRLDGEAMVPGPVGRERTGLREALRAQGVPDETISAALDETEAA